MKTATQPHAGGDFKTVGFGSNAPAGPFCLNALAVPFKKRLFSILDRRAINMSEATPHGSYDFEQMDNRETEFDLLRKRTTYRLVGLIPLLTEYGMENGKSILDVGCGQGIRTRQIAEQFPQSQVVGIDRSETMIEAAKTSSGSSPNLSFYCRDILDLPFEPDLGYPFKAGHFSVGHVL